jgi:hypothetical protein
MSDAKREEEIRTRLEAAAPEPWELAEDTCSVCREKGESEWNVYGLSPGYHGMLSGEADATFIANSRSDIAWLLEQIDYLTAQREQDAKRIEALEALVRVGFFDDEGVVRSDEVWCPWCDAMTEPFGEEEHKPDCEVRAARRALEGGDDGD